MVENFPKIFNCHKSGRREYTANLKGGACKESVFLTERGLARVDPPLLLHTSHNSKADFVKWLGSGPGRADRPVEKGKSIFKPGRAGQP
jgi:hypothetical protein